MNNQNTTADQYPVDFVPVIDDSFNINVNIHIACDTLDEIEKHLQCIREQIIERQGKNKGLGEWSVTDNNCYGTHVALINW